jgi:flagellar hook-length control protein FliK
MKLPVTQSMDMLLGVAAPQLPTMTNQPGTPVDGALFGDLLGMLMALQPVTPNGEMADPTQVSGDPLIDGLDLFAAPNADTKATLFTAANQGLFNPELIGQNGLPQTGTDSGMLLTGFSETDSAVTLTLTPVADQSKPIQLTISKEVFANIVSQLENGETPNADAKNSAFSPAMLQALLSKVNTKEITITETASPFGKQPVLNADVSGDLKAITTDKNANTVQLIKELPVTQNSVAVVAADELVSADTKTTQGIFAAHTLKLNMPQAAQVATVQPEQIQAPVTAVNQKEVTQLLDKDGIANADDQLNTTSTTTAKDGGKVDQFSTVLHATGTQHIAAETKANNETVVRPAIKLPENIHDLLKPYGKSVTLKIEPEHLGTATISLNMQQGALRARVVVESTAAKTMLENSLNQLVSQLAKSNITVDSVDVQVGGQSLTEHEFARHQQRQHRPYRNLNNRFADEKKLAAVTAQTSAISRYAFRAVPGGLNLVV